MAGPNSLDDAEGSAGIHVTQIPAYPCNGIGDTPAKVISLLARSSCLVAFSTLAPSAARLSGTGTASTMPSRLSRFSRYIDKAMIDIALPRISESSGAKTGLQLLRQDFCSLSTTAELGTPLFHNCRDRASSGPSTPCTGQLRSALVTEVSWNMRCKKSCREEVILATLPAVICAAARAGRDWVSCCSWLSGHSGASCDSAPAVTCRNPKDSATRRWA